jgi:ecdysone 20-monooxygenase
MDVVVSLLQIAILCLMLAALMAYLPLFQTWLSALSRRLIKRETRSPLLDIPGPPALPLIGAKWCFWSWIGKYRSLQNKYHVANEEMYREFGPVVREEVLWNFPLIHLFAKADIEQVLKYPTAFPLRPPNEADVFYRRYRKEFYPDDGVVNLNGPAWHKLRMLLTPPLTRRDTPLHYAMHMNHIAEDFVRLVGAKREEGSNVLHGFKDLVYRAGLETVSNVALERRMGFLDAKISDNTKLILDSIQGYQSSSNEAMYGLPLWKYVPVFCSSVFTNLVKHKDTLFRIIGQIVDESLVKMEKVAEEDVDLDQEKGILRQLLRNQELKVSDVKASVVDYITAGVDTIGNSIIFAMAHIAKHRDVQRKLQEELDLIIPGIDEEITHDKISKMKYLRACVTESFRLFPTASQLARIVEEETVVSDGHLLPKYSVVLCHHRIASLQEDNFSRAREYLPERWLEDSDLENRESFLVMPFGFGKRACPGKRLAQQEVHIIVAKLFQKYNVELIDELDAEFNWLLTPAGEMRLRVTDRKI